MKRPFLQQSVITEKLADSVDAVSQNDEEQQPDYLHHPQLNLVLQQKKKNLRHRKAKLYDKLV